jgi:hypothetical protein
LHSKEKEASQRHLRRRNAAVSGRALDIRLMSQDLADLDPRLSAADRQAASGDGLNFHFGRASHERRCTAHRLSPLHQREPYSGQEGRAPGKMRPLPPAFVHWETGSRFGEELWDAR